MTDNAKRKLTAFLLLAVIVIILIAAALPQLELKAGIPLPRQNGGTAALPEDAPPTLSLSLNDFFKAIFAVVVVALMAYSVYQLLKGVHWKEIVGPALLVATLTVIVVCILFALINMPITSQPVATEVLPPILKIDGPPLDPLPTSLIWLVWLGLAGAIVGLGIWISNRRAQQTRASDPLKLEAERALHDLRAGLDFKNVILQCYRQMSVALQAEQGLELKETMTAREFERLLEVRGIPHAPVHQLTQLFEAARYGLRPPDASDEQKAFDCLNAIVHYSRTQGQPR